MPRPMMVAAPSEVPVGRLKPFGNGLSRKAIGVRPSRLTTMELEVRKPIIPAEPVCPAAWRPEGA